MSKKLWGGRFKKKIDPDFEAFSASIQWDSRLLPYDIRINQAYVKALKKCGVLKNSESTKLLKALSALEKNISKPGFQITGSYEDVHSFVQADLAKRTGELAEKIHTGRSRNDLVAQSSRLYCKAHALKIQFLILSLQKEIVKKADDFQGILLPGMTHLQNAQVLSQAHIYLAYAEMLQRDQQVLALAASFADVCVLGSGALAGSTFNLDQALIAKELGLSRVTDNSYDVSGDRDFALQFLYALTALGIHLSRISEDLMIAQTKAFGLADIDESFCTGSSMMPQKKNADFVELSRGAAGTFIGNLNSLAATLKGLPTSYNRDLQWDKKSLFDSVETAEQMLVIFIKLFKTIKIKKEKVGALLEDESLYATDLADFLVKKGVSFKQAHHEVGQIVVFAEANGLPISKIGLDILQKFSPKLDGSVYGLFSAKASVSFKKTKGSTNPAEIKRQIRNWNKKF